MRTLGWSLVLLAWVVFPVWNPTGAAVEKPGPEFRCEIDGVQVIGKEVYELQVKIMSWKQNTFPIRSVENRFSVQGTRLGAWIELSDEPETPLPVLVPEAERLAPDEVAMTVTVRFPKDLTQVYRNAEDEVNLKLVSIVTTVAPGGKRTETVETEQFYWVTPGTSSWVLREGM